jgi:hypothetical protein
MYKLMGSNGSGAEEKDAGGTESYPRQVAHRSSPSHLKQKETPRLVKEKRSPKIPKKIIQQNVPIHGY